MFNNSWSRLCTDTI